MLCACNVEFVECQFDFEYFVRIIPCCISGVRIFVACVQTSNESVRILFECVDL